MSIELGGESVWESLQEFVRRRWFVVALLAVGLIVTAVGYLAYRPAASGMLAPLAMLFNSYRLGWIYVASMFVPDESVALLLGTVLMGVYTSAVIYIVGRPLFEYENLLKAATVVLLIALVAVAIWALIEVVRRALGW